MKQVFAFLIFIAFISCSQKQQDVSITLASKDAPTSIYVDPNVDALILWAVNDLAGDIEQITGQKPVIKQTTSQAEGAALIIGQVDDKLMEDINDDHINKLKGQWESFHIDKINAQLVIAGSDVRGTLYGIFDVAEKLGISPWKWWADVHPEKKEKLVLTLPGSGITESPSVQYRGIFLNDEDWGLQPWAALTYEPETGDIGPKTYEKIFQLLLRLKANTIWPAMHSCTKAFYRIPGNNEMAQKYHIVVGTSHCEPMLRNNVDEWDHKLYGEYNFFDNRAVVCDYWQDRVNDVSGAENIFTLGMRGIHDGHMKGGDSDSARVAILEEIIDTQRQMLADSKGKALSEIPQNIVLYKEVLDLYNKGMKVPDDVTIMWCDDNYGYIRRLSNAEENKRTGSSGVYYHLSYWGRPHDYLWLSTNQPALIWQEMKKAYENGADRIWIANVGDIKPAEYNTELFLDIAWDVNKYDNTNLDSHMSDWATREFGSKVSETIRDIKNEFYRLAFLRKPEYMGWSQTEHTTPVYPSEFNTKEQLRRIELYQALLAKTDSVKQFIPENKLDAFYQLIEYPVKGAANMNYKFMYYQLAMESTDEAQKEAYMTKAREAYNRINAMTTYYNNEMSQGKWQRMMTMDPRGLPVFDFPDWKLKDKSKTDTKKIANRIYIQGGDFSNSKANDNYKWEVVNGLGYSNQAVTIMPFKAKTFDAESLPWIEYQFEAPDTGAFELQVRCLPSHANNFDHQLSIQIDDEPVETLKLNTRGRSWQWKINTLRNSQIVKLDGHIKEPGTHKIKLYVNQNGIVIDQLAVDFTPDVPFYEIPYGN